MRKHNETIEEMTMDAAIELAEQEEAEESRRRIHWIDAGLLIPHPDNPRKDLGDLTEMAESIKAKGLLQNLTVVDCSKMDTATRMLCRAPAYGYMVVIGHRRLAAAKLAGVEELPCAVVPMDYQEMLTTMLTENVQRVDLNPYEQAQGFRQLSMELGMSVAEISERTGFGETTVRRRLKLGMLDGDTLRRVTTRAAEKGRQLSMADLEAVADIEDEATRTSVLRDIGTDNFNIRLRSALKAQKEEQDQNEWRRLLKARGLVEIPQNKVCDGNTWKTCVRQQDSTVHKPTDEAADAMVGSWLAAGGQYGFAFYYGWLYIKRNISQEKQEPTPAKATGVADTEDGAEIAKAMEESSEPEQKGPTEEDLRRAACDRLAAAFESAYECRRGFIDGMSEEVGKRVLPAMVELYVKLCEIDANIPELTEDEAAAIRRRLEKKPHAAAVYLLYAQMGDTKHSSCYHVGFPMFLQGTYDEDSCDLAPMELIYDAFVSVGYGMSDMEKALLDGTSPLYYHEGYSLDEPTDEPEEVSEADETDEERAAVPDVGGIPVTRFDVLKALTKEELAAYVAAFDRGRDPERAAELLTLIPKCETADELFDRIYEWFCYDIPCPEEDEITIGCNECILRWLKEERAWTVEMLMDSIKDGDSEDV